MEKDIMSSLHKAIGLLEKHGYQYAIIGGLAVSTWGRTRTTYDIDIKVLVPQTDYPSVRGIIRSVFPERARPHIQENPLIVDTKVDNVIVDFLLAIPGYEENIITRAKCYNMEGFKVWICSAEDLIIQKTIAGRAQDWQDIEGILIEQYEHLDTDYIKDWLKEFAEVLEQPEILSRYQDIQNRIDEMRL
ncbi:MAG: nucleotidyltransferase [bacterium]|nr:nucleotidyltransferase [bacterium]